MRDAIDLKWEDDLRWQMAVQAATNILKIFSFPEFFAAAAEQLAQLLDSDGVALIVYDGPEQLRYKLFHGLDHLDRAPIVKFSFPADQGTVGRVLATGNPLFTADYPRSEDAMPEFIAAGLQANLVLPLPGPSGFTGAIAITWLYRHPAPPSEAGLAIAEMFAALIGSAIYREALETRLEGHSLTDPLTGLPNRRMLMHRITNAQQRARRNRSVMALAVLDLDGFKAVNDELGHIAGDQRLLQAATAIRRAVRDVDMVARFGGDEFVVLLEDLRSPEEVQTILGRIVSAVADECANSGTAWRLTASLGASIDTLARAAPEGLLRNADEAMYRAKRNGGNQFIIG